MCRLDIDAASHLLHQFVADAQPQSGACVGTCGEALKEGGQEFLFDAFARIVDSYDQTVADVVDTCPDKALHRVLTSIGDDLVYDDGQVLGVDVYHELLVGILYDVLHTVLSQVLPAGTAVDVEELGEVGELCLDLYHLCVEAREEEDVVDEFQQVARVLLDLLYEYDLVVAAVLHLE